MTTKDTLRRKIKEIAEEAVAEVQTPITSGAAQPNPSYGAGGPAMEMQHNDLEGRSDADAHPAAAITNTPQGNLAAVEVQAALNELDAEKLARDGTQPMLGELDMGTNKIKAVVDPTLDQDAATKKYVDDHVGGGGTNDHLVKATDTDPTPSSLLGGTLNEDGTIAVASYENPETLDQFLTLNLTPAFKAIPFVTGAASAILSGELPLGSAVIMRGDLGDRPAAGTSGRIYVALDLGTVYRDNGVTWDELAHLSSPASYADFAQDFYEGVPASWELVNGVLLLPSINGLVGLMPPATVDAIAYLYLAFGAYDPLGDPLVRFSLGAHQVGYVAMRAGLAADWISSQPTDGIYVERVDDNLGGNWQGVCRADGVQTTTDLGVMADTAVHHFGFKKTGASVRFYHDDAVAGVPITTNIPAGALLLGAHIIALEKAPKGMTLDYFLTRCTR